MSDKINAAAKATDQILEHFNAARSFLDAFMVNGFGVAADPSALRTDLEAALENIKRAKESLDKTDWPTPEDYDAE